MLNDKGYHRPTYEEILNTKIERAIQLFGSDIDTSEQTPLGKFIRLGAYDLEQAYEDIEDVYYARFPNTASGISLDRLCTFASIKRNPATHAIHKIRVYSTQGTETSTEIGYYQLLVCGSDDSITFHNDMPFILPPYGEYVDINVSCTVAGTIGNVSSILNVVNAITEIDRIAYVGIVSLGKDEESDYDLRKRFAESVEGAGSSNVNAIKAAITRISSVISANIIVNEEDIEVDGRPPRSFECYVYGGESPIAELEIAETIFSKAPIGIKSCSTSSNPVNVTVRDSGGYPHTVSFSHTEPVQVTVTVKYKKSTSYTDDGDSLIKKNISEIINNLGVGSSVILTSLYGCVYSVTGVKDVISITLSTDGTEGTAANIDVSAWQVAQTSEDSIILEVVE